MLTPGPSLPFELLRLGLLAAIRVGDRELTTSISETLTRHVERLEHPGVASLRRALLLECNAKRLAFDGELEEALRVAREARRQFDQADRLCPPDQRPPDRMTRTARGRCLEAEALSRSNEEELRREAVALLDQAQLLVSKSDDHALLLDLVRLHGRLHRELRQLAPAWHSLQRAAKLAQTLGRVGEEGIVQRELGYIAADRGDVAEAEQRYREALDRFKRGDYVREETLTRMEFADLQLSAALERLCGPAGEEEVELLLDRARHILEEATRVFAAGCWQQQLPICHVNLAVVERALGLWEPCAERLAGLEPRFRDSGDVRPGVELLLWLLRVLGAPASAPDGGEELPSPEGVQACGMSDSQIGVTLLCGLARLTAAEDPRADELARFALQAIREDDPRREPILEAVSRLSC